MSLSTPQRPTRPEQGPQAIGLGRIDSDDMTMLPSDMAFLLEPEVQLDLLLADMNRTRIRTQRMTKNRSLLRALRAR